MLLRVEHGYVSQASKLFGRGDVVEMDDTAAVQFLRSGQAVRVDETVAPSLEGATADPDAAGQAVRVDETVAPSLEGATADPDAAGLPDLGADAVITPAKSGQKRK